MSLAGLKVELIWSPCPNLTALLPCCQEARPHDKTTLLSTHLYASQSSRSSWSPNSANPMDLKGNHGVEVLAADYDSKQNSEGDAQSAEPVGFWAKFNKWIQLDSAAEGRYSNHDLDPVPVEERTWLARHYALFWISDHLSVSGFRTAASVMAIGLSWKLSLGCIALANIIQGVVITANGIGGTKYHIPFWVEPRVIRLLFVISHDRHVHDCYVNFGRQRKHMSTARFLLTMRRVTSSTLRRVTHQLERSVCRCRDVFFIFHFY
ncbi:permease for cytosine/purines, uracil, thiamine, allantoin-domain-containing protein [Lipomyces chichibuensis]|uniref:permease for cytosine/purines, uracil, thiamine, allantoin-domain-containing protein n=1 Tax=Lipomyces chichibuensis TaxID=1546026 RepID=UPI00334340B9